jgi:hypothetical protein
MYRLLLSLVVIFISLEVLSQGTSVYQKGMTAEQNLKALLSLAPYSDGAVGFDNRYQGIRGSPRLFDTLLASFLLVKGQDYYIQVAADLDIAGNSVLFNHPKTGKLTAIPADIVSEIIINKDNKELLFRTTAGTLFDREMKEMRFIQVIKEAPVPFIKMPVKTFIEADYKGAYSPDRRYDEFDYKTKYYLMGKDNVFHQVQLNKKSLEKIYPERKAMIESAFREQGTMSDEEIVISIIEKF